MGVAATLPELSEWTLGLTLRLVSLCIIISVVESIWMICFILEYFCLLAKQAMEWTEVWKAF